MNQEIILTQLQQTLMVGKILPQEAVHYRLVLSGYYSFYSEQLEGILTRKPKTWMAIRSKEGCKSDKQADREYELCDDGINEIGLSMRLKRLEKQMSALKTIVDTSNTMFRHTE